MSNCRAHTFIFNGLQQWSSTSSLRKSIKKFRSRFPKPSRGARLLSLLRQFLPLCLMFDTPGPDYWLQYVAQTLNQQVNVHAPAEFCEQDIVNSTPRLANLEDGWSQVVHLGFFFFSFYPAVHLLPRHIASSLSRNSQTSFSSATTSSSSGGTLRSLQQIT